MTHRRRTRPRIFNDSITLRVKHDTKEQIRLLGRVQRRRFTELCRRQIEITLDDWKRDHPQRKGNLTLT